MDTPTPPPGAATQPDPDGSEPTAEQRASSSDFSRFLAHARDRRTAPAAASRDVPDWVHPDPAAGATLPAHRRPVARLLARRGGRPKSRGKLALLVVQVCRLLQDADGVPAAGRRLGDIYPWHHVDADHAARYRQLVQARYRNVGTRNNMLSVLREVLRECRRADLISAARFESLLEHLPTTHPARTSRGPRGTRRSSPCSP